MEGPATVSVLVGSYDPESQQEAVNGGLMRRSRIKN